MTETQEQVTEQTFANPMQKMQFDALAEMIKDHNALVTQVNAATGDKDALAEAIVQQDEFADLRNKIAELQEQLDAAVDVKVQEALSSDQGDVTEATEKAKELKGTITSGINYYKKLYGDSAAEAFPKQERLKGASRAGSGAGGRRIRGFRVIITDANGPTEYENFANASKALGIDTKDLQEHFFAKAGAEKLADVPDEVTFTLEWEDVAEDGTKSKASATVKAYREVPTGTSEEPEADEPEADEPEDETVSFDED
jgi:hypothetical protein